MELTKQVLFCTVLSFVVLGVAGCGRLKCYKCNSQDSPSTCGEDNFDASVHRNDVVSGSVLVNHANKGTSCIYGWFVNGAGTYYYRDKSNSKLWDGCSTPQACACNEDLCNSSGPRVVSTISLAATSLLFSGLAMTLVKTIMA